MVGCDGSKCTDLTNHTFLRQTVLEYCMTARRFVEIFLPTIP